MSHIDTRLQYSSNGAKPIRIRHKRKSLPVRAKWIATDSGTDLTVTGVPLARLTSKQLNVFEKKNNTPRNRRVAVKHVSSVRKRTIHTLYVTLTGTKKTQQIIAIKKKSKTPQVQPGRRKKRIISPKQIKPSTRRTDHDLSIYRRSSRSQLAVMKCCARSAQ